MLIAQLTVIPDGCGGPWPFETAGSRTPAVRSLLELIQVNEPIKEPAGLVATRDEPMDQLASIGPSMAEIIENFSLLDEWDERYRYVIELGRGLGTFPEHARNDANKVPGCVSQVWLETSVRWRGSEPVLTFIGDSDAHIVRGLVAILIAMLSDRPAHDIMAADPIAVFEQLGLRQHLTPQRSNGFRSMVNRMRADARAALSQ
jgi:cysteine desulfuration protein SufE